jgi:hypothetical protein
MAESNPNQVTVQMLAMADYCWFEKYLGPTLEKVS